MPHQDTLANIWMSALLRHRKNMHLDQFCGVLPVCGKYLMQKPAVYYLLECFGKADPQWPQSSPRTLPRQCTNAGPNSGYLTVQLVTHRCTNAPAKWP